MITVENILQETRLWPQFEQLNLALRLFEQALAQTQALIDEDRHAAFRRVRGKYKHLLPTVAEFQAEKRRELELEESRFAERFEHRAELHP
ncbi:MAG: hypothetical protein ACREAM_20920 [Blastocatellia bacterium]